MKAMRRIMVGLAISCSSLDPHPASFAAASPCAARLEIRHLAPGRLAEPGRIETGRVEDRLGPGDQIGDQMALSANTVKSHTRSLFTKLAAHNRVQALSAARERGLIGSQ